MALETPNYTQIPNEVFAVMHKMAPAELKVVLAVCRQTFGWHKQRDRISVSQLVALTGLSRQGVLNGIDAAKEHGFLIAYEVGNSFEYEINVGEMVNEVDQFGNANGQESRPVSVNEVDQFAPKMVNEVDPQKKGIKEKKEISADAQNASIANATEPKPANPISYARSYFTLC
jgi:phage replication O-like protein O